MLRCSTACSRAFDRVRQDGAKIEVADAAETARVGPAQGSPSGSDGTARCTATPPPVPPGWFKTPPHCISLPIQKHLHRRREEDENPTSKEGSAPGLNGGNSSLQHAKGAHGSNGNGNGSNGNGASATTPAHGSNNGHGASTMHVYAGRVAINGDSPAAARPILYATHDGSGNGSGDGGQDGSGQGSGSGNRASQSAVLCGAAQEQRDPRDPAKLGSSDAVGSSAVRAAPAPAAEAADGQQAQPLQQGGPAGPAAGAKQAETAARQAAVAWSAQLHRQQDGPPAAPGFRAWVSPRQPAAAARATVGASLAASGAQASNGARRLSSGCADCQTAPSPSAGAGSAAVPATVGSVAAAPSERFGSGVTVGTGNGTGGSTGTQIAAAGDASTQGGSTAATPRQQQQQQLRLGSQPSLGTATRTGVAAGHSEAQPQGSRALPPLPGLPQPQPPVQQAGGTAQAAQAQAQAQHQQQQQHQQQRAEFMQQRDAAAQWVSAQHGAAAQLHRLQQHHQQHHQIMSSYAGSAAALGALSFCLLCWKWKLTSMGSRCTASASEVVDDPDCLLCPVQAFFTGQFPIGLPVLMFQLRIYACRMTCRRAAAAHDAAGPEPLRAGTAAAAVAEPRQHAPAIRRAPPDAGDWSAQAASGVKPSAVYRL